MTLDPARLRRQVRASGPVFDFHTHPVDGFGPYAVDGPARDVRLLVQAAQRAGVSRVVVFSLHASTPRRPTMRQCIQANDYVLRMRDAEPTVVVPFCYVTPEFPEASTREVERCVGSENMAGIKLWVARRATDPGLDPIVEKSIEFGVPVVQHAWRKTVGQLEGESFPEDVADLARRFPEARLVMAHLNGVNPRGLEAVRPYSNVWVDTSGGDPQNGLVALAVRRLGSARVVFGSDAPIRHPAVMLTKVLGANLVEEETRDILWNNAARLLPSWTGIQPIRYGTDSVPGGRPGSATVSN